LNTKHTVKIGVLALAAIAFGVFVPAASASVIGTLFTGSGSGITVSLTSVIWNTDPGSNPPNGVWNGEVSNVTSLSFSGCSGVLGTPGCLDVAPFAPNEAVEINQNTPLTAGTVLPESGFLLFAGNGVTHVTINYTLTQVQAGPASTNCAGLLQFQSCAIFAGSPVVLTLQGTGTTATLNLAGTVTDGTVPVAWTGKFSSTFPNLTPAQIQSFYCTGPGATCTAGDFASGRSLATSNSGSFTSVAATTVPEPSSMIFIGAGLVGLAFVMRRKSRNMV